MIRSSHAAARMSLWLVGALILYMVVTPILLPLIPPRFIADPTSMVTDGERISLTRSVFAPTPVRAVVWIEDFQTTERLCFESYDRVWIPRSTPETIPVRCQPPAPKDPGHYKMTKCISPRFLNVWLGPVCIQDDYVIPVTENAPPRQPGD